MAVVIAVDGDGESEPVAFALPDSDPNALPRAQSLLFTGTQSVAGALLDSSGGAFVLDRASSRIMDLNISHSTSTSGCVTATWANWALGNLSLQGVDHVQYTFK